MGIEIDQQVRAEEALRAREQEARELLNRMPAMLSIQGRMGVEFVSDRFVGYVGRPLEDVRGNGWISADIPTTERESSPYSKPQPTALNLSICLWRIADRNGNYRWFHTHSEPFIAWCQP